MIDILLNPRYKINLEQGQRSMGTICLAHDGLLKRYVAGDVLTKVIIDTREGREPNPFSRIISNRLFSLFEKHQNSEPKQSG